MHSQADWSRLAGQFQQDLGEGWKKAAESFEAMARNANPSASSVPQVQFDAEQMQQ